MKQKPVKKGVVKPLITTAIICALFLISFLIILIKSEFLEVLLIITVAFVMGIFTVMADGHMVKGGYSFEKNSEKKGWGIVAFLLTWGAMQKATFEPSFHHEFYVVMAVAFLLTCGFMIYNRIKMKKQAKQENESEQD